MSPAVIFLTFIDGFHDFHLSFRQRHLPEVFHLLNIKA
jgi:hypothetical protein